MRFQLILASMLVLMSAYCLTGCQLMPKGEQTWDQMLESAKDARAHGQYDEAEKYFNMAIDDGETKHPDQLTVAIASSAYANMKAGRGQYQDAEKLYKKAIEIYQKDLGGNSKQVVQARQELVNVLRKEHKEKEAQQILAQDKSTPSPPPEHGGHKQRQLSHRTGHINR